MDKLDNFQEMLDKSPTVSVVTLLTINTKGDRPKHFDYIQQNHSKPAIKIFNSFTNRVSDKTLKEKNGRWYFIVPVDYRRKKTFYLDEFTI